MGFPASFPFRVFGVFSGKKCGGLFFVFAIASRSFLTLWVSRTGRVPIYFYVYYLLTPHTHLCQGGLKTSRRVRVKVGCLGKDHKSGPLAEVRKEPQRPAGKAKKVLPCESPDFRSPLQRGVGGVNKNNFFLCLSPRSSACARFFPINS